MPDSADLGTGVGFERFGVSREQKSRYQPLLGGYQYLAALESLARLGGKSAEHSALSDKYRVLLLLIPMVGLGLY